MLWWIMWKFDCPADKARPTNALGMSARDHGKTRPFQLGERRVWMGLVWKDLLTLEAAQPFGRGVLLETSEPVGR